MSVRHQETSITGIGQSPGCDPKNSKRSSGLFSFFKWFKTSTSRESVSQELSSSSSCDSLNSTSSTGTIASFSFISPINYKAELTEKNIIPGPETDTYRARLKQRDKRRENDKNVTLRKKYNLFFNRDTILKPTTNPLEEIDNSKSLPLMTKKNMKSEDEEKIHRRTNSESSKLKKAGAYCHVKGKRKAPPPPTIKLTQEGTSTMSLRRKKRLAPQPPAIITPEKVYNSLEKVDDFENIEYADAEVIFNDSLKLDHGVLKPVKLAEKSLNKSSSSITEPPVSPRPWYKRSLNRDSGINFKKEKDNKYEPIELAPDKSFKSSKVTEKPNKKKEDKRKSGISFLTNISELDREASEIIKKENKSENEDFEPPPFMRPKHETIKTNSDSWITPKRKSAKDLIAKFNAITSVTKVTVNSAFFGTKESGVFQKENLKRDYFGISSSIKEEPLMHTKVCEFENNKTKFIPLMKSESAVIKTNHLENKEATSVKFDKKSWFCPKCMLENDYWRIICYVCATIKPYFDDLTSTPVKNISLERNKTENLEVKHFPTNTNSDLTKNTTPAKYNNNLPFFEKHLERSKTQIGFSALAKYSDNGSKEKKFFKSASVEEKPKASSGGDKQNEKERLKKMLIEMKNSLPKKRLNCLEKNNNRASVIEEKVETKESKNVESDEVKITTTMTKNEKIDTHVAEVVIATTETIYENIKVKKTDNPKPIKISSSAQTSAIAQKEVVPPNILESVNKKRGSKSSFELLRPKDFANIYSVKTEKPEHHIYTNLMEDKQDFFNVALKFDEIKNSVANNTDTLEVNRLLKRLESAIGKGELTEASKLARDLAQLKINCSVVRQKSIDNGKSEDGFTVNMYVEDKVSHRGPFPIQVTENQTVAQLKTQVENEFLIPAQVQRWILGKKLVADDGVLLKDLNVKTEGCSIFLYLVAPTNENKAEIENKLELKPPEVLNPQPSCSKVDEVSKIVNEDVSVASSSKEIPKVTKEEESKPNHHAVLKLEDNHEDFDSKTLKPENKNWECIMCTFLNLQNNNICAICATVRRIPEQKLEITNEKQEETVDDNKDEHYKELLNLDNADLVENIEPFECLVCLSEIDRHQGVTLRDCLHQFCKPCLTYTIEFSEEAEIKCPYRDDQYSCDILLQDREIKALLTTEMYDQFLAKSIAQAENKMDKSFHCKTPDCRGWCIFEDNVNYFHCPVCRKVNCLTCQAIHMGANCKQYQESLLDIATDENSQKTKEMLEKMVNKGEAINCPTCQVILMKKWGCDWLRCSMCKTEICWVTRGPRWGPAGKGDTSGGCKCGVNGLKCHPQCNYCH